MVYARRSRAKYPSAAPSCVSWQGVPNKSPWDVRCHHQPTCKLFKAYWLSRFFLVDQRNLSSCLVGTIFSLRFQPCFVGCGVGKSGLTCSVATIYDDVRCSTYSCISHCAMTCMWTASQSINQTNQPLSIFVSKVCVHQHACHLMSYHPAEFPAFGPCNHDRKDGLHRQLRCSLTCTRKSR